MKHYTEWSLARGVSKTDFEAPFAAVVPGACQLDYGKYAGLPDYTFSDNYKAYDDLKDFYWKYTTVIPRIPKGKRLFFVSKGIDYRFYITVDGQTIFEQEGMFKKVDVEIPAQAAGKELCVIIYPAPSLEGAPIGAKEATQSFKPPVCYGWDFHPRLITQGIWDETYFDERESSYIAYCGVTYILSDDRTQATVQVENEVASPCGAEISVHLLSPDGTLVHEARIPDSQKEYVFTVENVELWWCHNYGEPKLYSFAATLTKDGKVLDSVAKNIGFRRVRLVAQDCNWWLDRFPFTQACPPITVELNGVQIFAKGSNWVAPEVFPGLINDERYDTLLGDLKDMHANFVRCWGGAVIGKDRFFDDCDKLGLLVWQEFPLACVCYKDNDHYLEVARSEAEYVIRRLREHACMAIWCAGNELYVGGAQNTPQSHIIRLLNTLCFTLDKNTPWLDTSPMLGMRHGHYTFRNSEGEECFRSFHIVKATAYNEFGCPSMASYEYLQNIIPAEDLNMEAIAEQRPSWLAHNALKAWTNDSWIQLSNIEHYFGRAQTLKDTIVKSQILQVAGYKLMFEEARRQKQNCNFALNWCFDEPYPNAAGNSLLSYPAVKKCAYYGVENSLRDTVLSAKFKKFSWTEGETFQAELWLLNDGIGKVEPGTAEVIVRMENEEYSLMKWEYGHVETNKNKQGNTAVFVLPKHKSCLFEVILRCDNAAYNNSYKLLYYSKETAELAAAHREKPMDFDGITEDTIGMEGVEVRI